MDHGIFYNYSEEKKAWAIKLSGEFDIFNSTVLKNELNGLVTQKNADLIIDCTALDYMDSTSIGSLVAVLKNVKGYEGKVVLENLKPNLLKLFKITNLNKVFEIAGEPNE